MNDSPAADDPNPAPNPDAQKRAAKMRERAAAFRGMASTSHDPVIYAELRRLALLYEAQAERLEKGEPCPPDPGETS